MKNNVLYIKFLGVRGSGKSTIASFLKERLINDGHEVTIESDFTLLKGRIKRRMLVILCAFREKRSFNLLIRFIILKAFSFFCLTKNCRPYLMLKTRLGFIQKYLIRNFLIHKTNANIYIFEEDETHLISTQFENHKISDTEITNFLNEAFLDKKQIIVFNMQISESEVVKRVVNCSQPTKRKLKFIHEKGKFSHFYKNAKQIEARIKDMLESEETPQVNVLEVDATKPPEEIARYIAGVIEEIKTK